MIEIKHLSYDFVIGKKGKETVIPVLHDINLKVSKGEIVTIVGRSGSGKSTLLNLVGGFIHPKEGEIWINNQNVSSLNEGEFADYRINHLGFIFQNFQLISSMTAFQNVELPLILKGIHEVGKSKAKLYNDDKKKVRFRDVT